MRPGIVLDAAVKCRDKFAPSKRLALSLPIGVLPYDRNDLIAGHLAHGKFELAERRTLERVLPHCSTFVDVGANLGFYTLLAARRMPPDSRVFAFEASPLEANKLQWTIERNRLTSVTMETIAVSDHEGGVEIHESLSGGGALNRLDGPAKPKAAYRRTHVPSTTLERYFAERPGTLIDVIKIDVEGHETQVLRGAMSILTTHRPVLMVEMNESRGSAESSPAGIFTTLVDINYRWFAATAPGGHVIAVSSPRADVLNLFAVPLLPRNASAASALVASS